MNHPLLKLITRGLYLILLLFSTHLWSQSYTISGLIIDESRNPVAFSNILLLKAQDSTIVTGVSSDDNGRFLFNEMDQGSYILKVSFVSYEDNYTNILVNNNLVVPPIVLKEQVEALSEIELVYRKPTIDRTPDRLIFNVEKTALSEGNLLEVLRSTPRVLVLDDALMVKGATPTIYINDRKVHISSREVLELLQGTSASNIKSVEVITNPPARYDAESGVVLNIVMSQNLVSGYNGSIFTNATQGVFVKTNHGMSNYFKGENIGFFANYSYSNRKDNREDVETIDYPDQFWTNNVDRNTWTETHNFNMNFDWDLDERNVLSFAANTQFLPYFKRRTRSNTDITPLIDTETGRFHSINISRDKRHNLGFDVDFSHKFKNNGSLSFNSHYTTYDYERRQGVNTNYFFGNNSFETSTAFNTLSEQDTKIFTSQLDYATPLNESSNFEMGVKFSNVDTGSDNIHNDIIGNSEVLNPNNTDTFNYDEKVYAAYVSYDVKWEKWSLITGLRAEQTNIEGVSVSTNQTNKQDYLEWFPTASVDVQVSEKANIYANYRRSLNRPDYSYLNPFKYFLNDKVFVTGNPNLRPVFSSSHLLGISLNKGMFTIETYYKKYKNNVFELPFQNDIDNTLAHTSVNINFTEEIGLDLEANFNVMDNWSVYAGTSIYNVRDDATLLNENFNRDRWSNYSVLQTDFSLLKDNSLMVSFRIDYAHKNIQGLQTVDSRIDSSISLRKTMLKGKGSLSLYIQDPFNEQDFFWTTRFGNQNNTQSVDLDNRYVRLGFRYKFGNTKLSTNQRSSQTDERGRLGQKH